MPVSRTLAVNYTQDEKVFDVKYQNQFLFGDAILVAPVESTKQTAEVYLPAGDWYRLSSGEKFAGGLAVLVAAPLTDLPVFIKPGGIVPMQHVIQSTNEQGDGILELHIWYGKEANSFVYYEDDGSSYAYQKGAYYKRKISFDPAKKQISLAAVEGSFISKYTKIALVLHGFEGKTKGKMKKIDVNGKALEMTDNAVSFPNSSETIKIDF